MAKTKKQTEEPAVPRIPSADKLVLRIQADIAKDGESFRASHPELVSRLVEMLAGVKSGKKLYVENRDRKLSYAEVERCLAGLGYEVKPTHPMVLDDYCSFWIRWWPEEKANPYLG